MDWVRDRGFVLAFDGELIRLLAEELGTRMAGDQGFHHGQETQTRSGIVGSATTKRGSFGLDQANLVVASSSQAGEGETGRGGRTQAAPGPAARTCICTRICTHTFGTTGRASFTTTGTSVPARTRTTAGAGRPRREADDPP